FQIVLSIIYQNGQLGAAYYNTIMSELYILEDIAESNLNFDMTNVIYRQSRPSFIITTSGMAEPFLTLLKKFILKENENFPVETPSSNNRFTRLKFKIMSKKEYGFSSCNTRVQHLKLEFEPDDLTDEDRILFLSSIINFNCSIMIHALGLLLKYLDKHWNAMALDAIGQAKFVQLHKLNLKDIVMVDNETYKGLQIVNPRHHPSLFKFGTSSSRKEGLSLYSILNRCQSRPGLQYLWSMFQHPTCDEKEINERLDVIEFCLDPTNQNIVQNMLPCLSKIHQITKVMNRLSAPQAKSSEWQRLHKTLCNIIHIVDICETCKNVLPLFTKIVDSATDEMHRLRYFIEYIVDFESSKRQNKFVAHAGVDPQLDQLNHENQTLPEVLSLMAERDLQELPEFVKACSMVYLPDIGYLLAVTHWESSPPEDYELPGLEFKFVANNICHYKSPGAVELQNTVGDILEKITKRQSQIMMQLVQYITKHIKPVIEIIKYIAKLDALISLSIVARDLNYVRPKISKSKIIDIKQGRHPLLEIINSSFITNDTLSSQDNSLIKIITGPNACGKSIYLKQVALIVFMAHIGSYVPAESATIGVIKHILTRIHFADTMAFNASSFMADLRQMNRAVSDATSNSLVIIDEFGKGTSYIDALSLLAAYLTDFINRGAECPHMFVSTHLHSVVDLIPQTSLVEKQTLNFLINQDGTVVFLHKITNGNSGMSFAHSVAAAAGLESKIVERALSIYENRKKKKPIHKLQTLRVYQQEKLAEKICKHLVTEKESVDMDGLKSCITQMWSKNFGNQSSKDDTI
ncbi:mutS protein homolog 5-like, partial [Neodiprion virginianus]|uniref:mutS protein homolog 5-like n=1 Tax=Neodiprion virginianus TaxID=2961670 RepID=UPI001EE6E66F